jgi:hypothetical protein
MELLTKKSQKNIALFEKCGKKGPLSLPMAAGLKSTVTKGAVLRFCIARSFSSTGIG